MVQADARRCDSSEQLCALLTALAQLMLDPVVGKRQAAKLQVRAWPRRRLCGGVRVFVFGARCLV